MCSIKIAKHMPAHANKLRARQSRKREKEKRVGGISVCIYSLFRFGRSERKPFSLCTTAWDLNCRKLTFDETGESLRVEQRRVEISHTVAIFRTRRVCVIQLRKSYRDILYIHIWYTFICSFFSLFFLFNFEPSGNSCLTTGRDSW